MMPFVITLPVGLFGLHIQYTLSFGNTFMSSVFSYVTIWLLILHASAYSLNVGCGIIDTLLCNFCAIKYIASVAPLVTITQSALMPSRSAIIRSSDSGSGSG